MYDYHYDVVKSTYGDIPSLLFTDTDSLCYSIRTEDVYAEMKSKSDLFDFSNYPREHACFSDEKKKVIGKMKDELSGAPMIEFIGLRAKLYAYRQRKWLTERGDNGSMNTLNELAAAEDELKKCKGVGKA